ncbi:MAG: hypothetical protein ABIP93_19275 [Gemmatimonadaceae bacterium]
MLPRTLLVEHGVVTLGQALPRAVATAGVGDSLVALRPEPGSGVERIVVFVDESGRVRSITSDFQHGVSYDSLRAAYAESFGPFAASRPVRRGEVPSELAAWHDSSTDLRLLSDPNRSAWTVRRIVRDRAPHP